jgi:HSF-type DNA-binding
MEENIALQQFHTSSLKENPLSKRSAFPVLLHQLLEDAMENNQDDIIRWDDHGRSFRVHDPDRFVTQIMPKYFKQTRYASLRRQLALYSFQRVIDRTKREYGSYYHERFLRDNKSLASTIRRTAIESDQKNSFERQQQPYLSSSNWF